MPYFNLVLYLHGYDLTTGQVQVKECMICMRIWKIFCTMYPGPLFHCHETGNISVQALVINGFLTFWARLQGHLLIFCLDLAKCDHSDIICYFLWETYLAKYFQTSVRHTNQWRVIKIFSFIVILHKRSAESKQDWSEHSRHQFYNCKCLQLLLPGSESMMGGALWGRCV